MKLDLYLSSSSLHSCTRLSASTLSTIAEKVRWQMLPSFVITLCTNLSFLMVQSEWKEFQPSAILAAMLEYHLGSSRSYLSLEIFLRIWVMKHSFQLHKGGWVKKHVEQLDTGLSLHKCCVGFSGSLDTICIGDDEDKSCLH